MIEKNVLVLGRNLTKEGKKLGASTITRLQAVVKYAELHLCTVYVSATFSKNFPQQTVSMSTLMANWLFQNASYVRVVDIGGKEDCNTRGELIGFVAYANRHNLSQLVIASSWWHIPRVKIIFSSLFPDLVDQVEFVKLADSLTFKIVILEIIKIVFSKLPASGRDLIEKVVRRVNLDWS